MASPLYTAPAGRVVHGDHGFRGIDATVPAGDCAVLRGEQLECSEPSWRRTK